MSDNGEARRGLGRFFGPGTVKRVITKLPFGDELYEGGKNVYGDDGFIRGAVNVITDPVDVFKPALKEIDKEVVGPTREILRGTLDDVQDRVGRVIQGKLTPEEIAERKRQIEELEREIAEDEASRNQGNEDQLDLTGGRGKHGSGGNPGSGGLNIQGGQRRPGGGSFTGDTDPKRRRNRIGYSNITDVTNERNRQSSDNTIGGKAGGDKKAKGGLIKKAKGGVAKKAKGGVAKKVQKKAKGGAVKGYGKGDAIIKGLSAAAKFILEYGERAAKKKFGGKEVLEARKEINKFTGVTNPATKKTDKEKAIAEADFQEKFKGPTASEKAERQRRRNEKR